MLGLDLGVDLGAAGDDLELVDIAGVKPSALDGDTALLHLITLQLAVLDHRFAGGQGGFGGVDEAATVAADAVGVGDDDMGRFPGHFGVTLELAGAAAVNLVEDDAGRTPIEVGVAENNPTQLCGLGAVGGVIENHPLLADVVVAEFVMRQAAAIGCGDVDDGHAVGGLADAGGAAVDHDAVRLYQQRLPEHRVGEDEGQSTFGQAPERFTRLHGRRSLAGQEGELTNIHVRYLG